MLFEAEFQREVETQIAHKQATKDKTLVERLGIENTQPDRLARFKVEGDDKFQTLMYKSLLKDCAFYFDVPSIKDENKMKKTLQRKYDHILTPGWRAPLTSRQDLLTWACTQTNQAFLEKGFPEKDLLACDNYSLLLQAFGPNYDKLRPKLGFIRGLFD